MLKPYTGATVLEATQLDLNGRNNDAEADNYAGQRKVTLQREIGSRAEASAPLDLLLSKHIRLQRHKAPTSMETTEFRDRRFVLSRPPLLSNGQTIRTTHTDSD